MPLSPQIVEDVLALTEKHPDLTQTQVVVLQMAAALLWQDELADSVWGMECSEIDPRLRIPNDQWELIPDRFEIACGVVCPKEWATPNRLKGSEMWTKEFDALIASGMEHAAAVKLASQIVREKLPRP
jgi:hypothetical protein